MNNSGMRQMEERHVANQIDLMIWNHRLDLIAISNYKGEVQVHRLHWQKVWSLPPPKENARVDAMAWRPDGKALAIGYNTGSVYIIDSENKSIIEKYDFSQEFKKEAEYKNYGIPTICWPVKSGTLENTTEYNIYNDPTLFLQNPPMPNASYKNQNSNETDAEYKDSPNQFDQLNLLIVAYGTGTIFMSVFGRYPYRNVHLSQFTNEPQANYKILNIQLSDDFSIMQVLYMDRFTNRVIVAIINTSVLSAYSEELSIVAHSQIQIFHLLTQLNRTMRAVTEAWEQILLEMDTKMAVYASTVPEGGVSADLLELLMLGVPSDDLERFLLRDLTPKGLKKFGTSVELSYSTIQKLVLKQLNIIGQNLVYHLSELRGHAKIPDRYKVLGLDEHKVTAAVRACFAFLNKCLELQQVIDVSMRNYKAFFRWLFVVIVRLLDELTPSDIVKINQQELTHIADFLYNFDNVPAESSETSDKPVKFNLERLGQYLQDQELTIVSSDEDNPWHKILKENLCLSKNNDTIFCIDEFKKFSLIQQQKHMIKHIKDVFDINHAQHFSLLYNIKCYEADIHSGARETYITSQIFDVDLQRFTMALVNTQAPSQTLYFMSVSIKEKYAASTCKSVFSSTFLQENEQSPESLQILDIQFYSSEYLSVLLKHPHNEDSIIFVQLPLKLVLENCHEFSMRSRYIIFNRNVHKIDLGPLLDPTVYKVVDKINASKMAVSGARKVVVVLSNTQRKVKIFEMEVNSEEDDDEIFDSTSQSNITQSGTSQTTDKNSTRGNISF